MRKGFTLLEISVVLVIIALITGMAVSSGIMMVGSARDSSTRTKMRAIEAALASYRVTNNRLPCPGDFTITDGAANFGVEGATAGTCTGGSPSANFSGAGATNTAATGVEGALPVVTLGLPNDMMYDGWGHKFRYVVDKALTAVNAFSAMTAACENSAITIKDASGGARTRSAIYALISSGANGHGGYTKQGAMTNAASSNTDELANCHCDANAASTTYAPTYVQKDGTRNASTLSDTFDDIVSYKERWQVMSAWEKPATCNAQYIYIADRGNHRVEKFDLNGNYVTAFGDSTSMPDPVGVAVDSLGNIWVTNYSSGHTVDKYDSSGHYLFSAGTVGFSPGQTYNPYGVNVDSLNNIYVSAAWIGVIEKFNSSGVYQNVTYGTIGDGTIGSDTEPSAGYNCPNTTAFESGGNVWVVSNCYNKAMRFAAAGGYLSNFPVNPFYASNIRVDTSGHVWVGDNFYITEYNTSGTQLAQYGGPGGFNISGTWYPPDGFDFDASGNIWVDTSNGYLLKVDSTTGNVLNTYSGPGSGNGLLNGPAMMTVGVR